jgi:hypothetical protein
MSADEGKNMYLNAVYLFKSFYMGAKLNYRQSASSNGSKLEKESSWNGSNRCTLPTHRLGQ